MLNSGVGTGQGCDIFPAARKLSLAVGKMVCDSSCHKHDSQVCDIGLNKVSSHASVIMTCYVVLQDVIPVQPCN